MKKQITLGEIIYEVDTEKEIPPGEYYIDDDYPITLEKHLPLAMPLKDEYCHFILSCSDPAEAARLGVPVTASLADRMVNDPRSPFKLSTMEEIAKEEFGGPDAGENGDELAEVAFGKPNTFLNELESLINRHNMESGSDTPDFILAEYLSHCLEAFNNATQKRSSWYK